MNKLLLLFFLAIISTSCISTKKTTYFQGEPIAKENVHKINNTPYKLKTNDIININIKCENKEWVSLFSHQNSSEQGSDVGELYFTGYTVDYHGNIRLPYIGDINVLGYTTEEVREKLEYELKKYINYSNSIFVTVKLEGIKYTILGEIAGPGVQVLRQNQVNIIEAIASSGDILPSGNRKNILIVRNELDGIKKYTIDLTSISLFDSEIFKIKPNDIIYINPLKRKSWGIGATGIESFTTIASIFSIVATTILVFKTL